MTEAAFSYDVSGVLEIQDEQASGWCWSPQRPGEALRVELLSDGQIVASGIAARLVLERVRPGTTDGYHGYLLILPTGLSPHAILEAREARTGKVFARHMPKTLPDVMAWQRRVAQMGSAAALLHDRLEPGSGGARWSAAWGASGGLLDRHGAKASRVRPSSGLALRPMADPLWTVILDLVRVAPDAAEATARREVLQLAPVLSLARAELVVIDDGRAAGFLTGVAGLRYAGVPPGAGDVARLTVALGMARGVHIVIFAAFGEGRAGRVPVPGKLLVRAALLAEPSTDRVVVGGGVAAAIRGAGLDGPALWIERVETETGLLLMAPRSVCETLGGLDPVMDDGADLPLLEFALRARAAGLAVRVLEEALPARPSSVDPVAPRKAFVDLYRR